MATGHRKNSLQWLPATELGNLVQHAHRGRPHVLEIPEPIDEPPLASLDIDAIADSQLADVGERGSLGSPVCSDREVSDLSQILSLWVAPNAESRIVQHCGEVDAFSDGTGKILPKTRNIKRRKRLPRTIGHHHRWVAGVGAAFRRPVCLSESLGFRLIKERLRQRCPGRVLLCPHDDVVDEDKPDPEKARQDTCRDEKLARYTQKGRLSSRPRTATLVQAGFHCFSLGTSRLEVPKKDQTSRLWGMAKRSKDPVSTSSSYEESNDNPVWFKPVMFGLMLFGLAWILTYYISGTGWPIPPIGAWNIAVGFGIMFVGFLMTTRWK